MLSLWLLFAEDGPKVIDVLTPYTPWAGTGLAGLIMWWLLYTYLPAKDKQLKDYIDAKDEQTKGLLKDHSEAVKKKDEQIQEVVKEHAATVGRKDEQLTFILNEKWKALKELGAEYTASLHTVTQHCKEESRANAELWRHEFGQLVAAQQDIGEMLSRIWAQDAKIHKPDKRTMMPQDGPGDSR